MNIVFWILVVLVGVIIWFSVSPIFKKLGDYFCGMINRAKEGMEDNNEEK